jgi:rifampicin phosphotransferase
MHTRIDSKIRTLDEVTAADEARGGAKAFNCARLKQAGFPVPDGLVVLSDAPHEELAGVVNHAWFDGLPADTRFAVRSSGIGEDSGGHSFAGIHHTALGVRRDDLGEAIAACRMSASTRQALAYRRASGLPTTDVAIGVLVQCLIQPIASGVAFTVNPVSGADDEIVINASWGLGEALVSGRIDPDEFVVDKRDGKVRWQRIGDKGSAGARADAASLTVDQIRELSALLSSIERSYAAPQDVEWCHDGRTFWILQSRPVTTGHAREETEWTRANVAEVLPDLTSPQTLAVFEHLLNRAERLYLGRLLAPDVELGPMVKSFCGRLHFNLSQLRRVCTLAGVAPAEMLRSMGHAGAIHPADERVPKPSLRQLTYAPDLVRILWHHATVSRVIRAHERATARYMARLTAEDPRQLSDFEVWSVIDQWLDEAPAHMQTVLLLSNVMVHEAPVRRACERVGFPFEQLVYPQLATGSRSVSAQQAFDLVALADLARREPPVVRFLLGDPERLRSFRAVLRGTAFLDGLDRFLDQYGHRGLYEYDWSLPRYREDPLPLLRALRAHVASPAMAAADGTSARQEQEAAAAWAAFRRRVPRWRRPFTVPALRRSIRAIKRYYVWREQVRSDVVRVLGAVRVWHLALAERFVERRWLDRRDDYFLLELDEIAPVVNGVHGPDGWRAIVADRLAERERHRAIVMPLLMRESVLPSLIRRAGVSGGPADERELTGHVVSAGCVEAEVVVVRDPGDFARMKPGAILVAPATDPSWTPLLTLSSGVIVEIGGVLSHASTIAREYGLPALANVQQATTRLKTGERVRLDAVRGIVRRLSPAHRSLESKAAS